MTNQASKDELDTFMKQLGFSGIATKATGETMVASSSA